MMGEGFGDCRSENWLMNDLALEKLLINLGMDGLDTSLELLSQLGEWDYCHDVAVRRQLYGVLSFRIEIHSGRSHLYYLSFYDSRELSSRNSGKPGLIGLVLDSNVAHVVISMNHLSHFS